MNRSSEPGERAQHSVAELIARYGDAAPSTGRRRRRAPEDNHTAPQAIIDRLRTDSGPLPAVEGPVPRRSAESDLAERGPSSFEGPSSFADNSWSGLDNPPDRNGNGSWGLIDGLTDFDSRGGTDRGGIGITDYDNRGLTDLNGHRPGATGTGGGAHWAGADNQEDTWIGLPPVGAGSVPLNRRDVSGGPITDRFPRLDPAPQDPAPQDPAPQDPAPQEHPVVPDPARRAPSLRPGHRPDEWQPAAGLGTVPRQGRDQRQLDENTQFHDENTQFHEAPVPADDVDPAFDDDPAAEEQVSYYEVLDDEVRVEEPTSPVREWVVMGTQIGVGVVGGAVLWLICEWLWQRIPVVALVVALLVITGLVWVVRRVRRAEDLQTTVIAVLVGLFVTVSPAALLLVGR